VAAHLDGLSAAGLEQTGLAQKGGPVVSDLRISTRPIVGALRASRATVDVLIGLDLLGVAAESNLATADPERTIAVVNSAIVPTAAMVTHQIALPGSPTDALERIGASTRRADNLYLDALGLSEALFADHMPANMIVIGAAFQHGCLPLGADAIEAAVKLNGAAVDKNLAAFRWGRAMAVDPAAVLAAVATPERAVVDVDAESAELAAKAGGNALLRDVLGTRIADLTGYQDAAYARRYAEDVRSIRTAAVERAGTEAGERVAVAYARALHHLMAYKDEYEVARLHLDTVEQARRDDEFGADAKVSVLLHPPVLRYLGMNRKIRLRRTATPAFRALRAARGLRGTRWDVFGYAKVRRVERELVAEYRGMVRDAMRELGPDNVAAVVALVALPETIRGYEDIKLARVAEYRASVRAARARLTAPAISEPQPLVSAG
jgi:indolepyruvate ferredoxin oxidoreductase